MKLMIIDGNSLINRAFYGVRPLSTKDGVHTNAVFGFLNTYFKLLEEENPKNVCVCFDLKAKTFRHEQYEGYKAQRKGMPEELQMQMPLIKEILDALGVPRLEKEGYEADDLLGTLSQMWENKHLPCVVVTGDKDSLQLIGETTQVSIVSTRLGQTTTKKYDSALFAQEYNGLEPRKIIDLKSIMGDKSDNIPGVQGIGEKGAMDLIVKYGSLDQVYHNLSEDNMSKSTFKKLTESRDMAFLSYDLATIVRNVPLDIDENYLSLKPSDNEKLYELLSRLELFSIIKRLNLSLETKGDSPLSEELKLPKYKTDEAFIFKGSVAASYDDEVFSVYDGKNLYVYPFSVQLLESLNSLSTIFVHDSKPLFKLFLRNNIEPKPYIFDTAVAEYLLSPTDSSYSIEKSIMRHFSKDISESASDSQMNLFSKASSDYSLSASKAFYTFHMASQLKSELKENGLLKLFDEIEMPLVPVLARMEINGICCDALALNDYAHELTLSMDLLTKEIYELAGVEFNIGSPKQMGEVLFNKLGLKGGKKTKSGYSTDADTLEKLKNDSPVILKILEYRKYAKLKSTYCDGLIKAIGSDGRVHTTFNQLVTATGRLSSQDPNLQNIPIRTKDGENIRRAFTAQEGKILIDADYSQIELRVLAHISHDQNMLDAFLSGKDIHTSTASQVFHTPLDMVTPLQRRRAKAVNFGIVYGISAYALSEDLGVFVNEAQSYINSYFEIFSGVKSYMDSVKEEAKKTGFAVTMFGRRRDLSELKSSNHNIRSFGERVALNMPIQGAAADIMKIAMINVDKRLKNEGLDTKILLQVHDELVLEAPLSEKDRAAEILKQEMENAVSLSVPLSVDVNMGSNWLEAK